MTINDTHTQTLTLTHRENFSDGLTKLEAYVVPFPSRVISQLMYSHPLTNYTMMYVPFLLPFFFLHRPSFSRTKS
jgi:hypothetical protein